MMLRVQLESDLCRVEQIFIPDTHTSLCCSVLQHSGASARPKKHTSYNIASSTQCVFLSQSDAELVGQSRCVPGFKNGNTTFRTCGIAFCCSSNYSDTIAT